MGLLTFGPAEVRRSYVAAMRMVATANGSRPFAGPKADLVKAFAGLVGCAECHGLAQSIDFSDLLGPEEPWKDAEVALKVITDGLKDEKDRKETAHAALLVALYSPDPDAAGTQAARWLAERLGAEEGWTSAIEQIANENAATAKADVFRRMIAERIGVDKEEIARQMERHALTEISTPETVARFLQLVGQAPAGTVAAEMRQFYEDAAFDIPGTAGVPLPVDFLGAHDCHHVLAGYPANPHGEVYTAVFNAANSSAGIGWLTVVLLQWHQGIKLGVFPPAHAHLNPEIMASAAHRGSHTKVDIYDPAWDWMSLLPRPLEEVRAALGIPPGGSVQPGQSWAE